VSANARLLKWPVFTCPSLAHLARPLTKVTSGTTLSLSAATWYTAKVVLDTSGGSQRLRFWVDTDNDSSFADETTLLNTLVVDDDGDAGHVGLFRGKG
jgi:hypothetical protein